MAQNIYCVTRDSIKPHENQAFFLRMWRDRAIGLIFYGSNHGFSSVGSQSWEFDARRGRYGFAWPPSETKALTETLNAVVICVKEDHPLQLS